MWKRDKKMTVEGVEGERERGWWVLVRCNDVMDGGQDGGRRWRKREREDRS